MKSLRNLIPYVLRHRWVLAMGVFSLLAGTALNLLLPRVFGWAIDFGLVPRQPAELLRATIWVAVLEVARVAMAMVQGLAFAILGQRVMQNLRTDLFQRVHGATVSTLNEFPSGKLTTRVVNDVSSLADFFTGGIGILVSQSLLMAGYWIGLWILDWKIGASISVLFPVLIFVARKFGANLKRYSQEASARLSNFNGFVAEVLNGVKVVHLFNLQKRQQSKFFGLNRDYFEACLGSLRTFALFSPLLFVLSSLGIVFLILLPALGVRPMKPGELIAAFSYAMGLFVPLQQIAENWNIVLATVASTERIFGTLALPQEAEEQTDSPKGGEFLRRSPLKIEFDRVSFGYPAPQGGSRRAVLNELSFSIDGGEKLGIRGPTGCGKSTILQLLMRFYEPWSGEILLGGQCLRSVPRKDLRKIVGWIQQEVFLFSGTLEENIVLGDFRPQRIRWIQQEMASSTLFGKFLEQWRSPVLERGANWSAGERQLIAFLRVLYLQPRIWVLDEATANLDLATEKELEALFDRYGAGQTRIVIAHRLSPLRSADRILELGAGNS